MANNWKIEARTNYFEEETKVEHPPASQIIRTEQSIIHKLPKPPIDFKDPRVRSWAFRNLDLKDE